MSGAKKPHHSGLYRKLAPIVVARANADASTCCLTCGQGARHGDPQNKMTPAPLQRPGVWSTSYGDTDSRVKRAPNGTVTPRGYRRVAGHAGHVLAEKGSLPEHRLVLFDVIGMGPHQCAECNRHINWRMPLPDRLCVDHIDEDKLNNELANLRPLCHSCNIKRNREQSPSGAGFARRT